MLSLASDAHPDRHRLAVEQLIAEAGRGLERVADCVSVVEDRAHPSLALVGGHELEP